MWKYKADVTSNMRNNANNEDILNNSILPAYKNRQKTKDDMTHVTENKRQNSKSQLSNVDMFSIRPMQSKVKCRKYHLQTVVGHAPWNCIRN